MHVFTFLYNTMLRFFGNYCIDPGQSLWPVPYPPYLPTICQKLKRLWHFEIFVNTGPYWSVDCKRLLLLQFLSDPCIANVDTWR